MAGNKHNHKRGAPGDRRGHNPINSRPPREHIAIIGGPCNSFNAWWSYVDLQPEYSDGSDDGFWSAQPAPRTMREIDYYLQTAPTAVPVTDAKDPAAWRKAGWSADGIRKLQERSWDSAEIEGEGPETHDLYWANFVDPAVRLYSKSSPLKAPLRRPNVRRGDIVTFMIYAPAYELRQQVDYSASPYNPVHRNKFGIKGNPEYDPSISRGPKPKHPPSTPATVTNQDRQRMAQEQVDRKKARQEYQDRPLSEQDIDHYILMRTTNGNGGNVIKRPPNGYCYFDYLEGIIHRALAADDVMTKILFFSEPQQVVHYLGDGSWTGEPKVSVVNESDLDEEASAEEQRRYDENKRKLEEFYNVDTDTRYGLHNFKFTPPVPQKEDARGRPLDWKLYWSRHWNGAPRVDREKIKIARLDYFGHSSSDELMLQWGWDNNKGETPDLDVNPVTDTEIDLTYGDFEAVLSNGQLTGDAYACLWGCSAGKELAPNLAKLFRGGVVATTTYTTFENIVKSEANMPEPVDGVEWNHYKAGAAEPVGAR